MATLEALRDIGIFRKKIHLAEAFHVENPGPEDAAMTEAFKGLWVEMREPTRAEAIALGDAPAKNMSEMDKIVPACMRDHNILRDDGKRAEAEQVYELIRNSVTLVNYFTTQWMGSLPLARRGVTQSAK